MWVFLSSGCEIEATECVDQQTLCTAAPSLIFIRNESEAARDRHTSLKWVVPLFNVFLDCSANETLQ